MKQLPENVEPYHRTPEFNEDSVPKGLLKEHKTKDSVWGEINVLEGELEYTINEPEVEVLVLNPERKGVVEPAMLHEVKPLGKVRFYVQFYK